MIASEYNGLPVTSIGDSAFSWRNALTSITIPDSVTSIGARAFAGCDSLKEVYISDIEAWFAIDFVSNSSNPLYNGAALYLNGKLITSLEIPDSVTSIGDSAFYGCTSLSSIAIPDSVTSIGDSAFYGCGSLTSITIPDSVTSIGFYVFSGCDSLESIIVEEGNTVYHSEGNCIIRTDSKRLIVGCKKSVIPSDGSVTSIGDSAFSDCDSLTSITIPEGITSIGWGAFYDCSSLTVITIWNSVTRIEGEAFAYCTRLGDIIFEGTTAQWRKISKGVNWGSHTRFAVINCDDGVLDRNGNPI